MSSTNGLWLDPIPTSLRAEAVEALKAGKVGTFLFYARNQDRLNLVWLNNPALIERGCYEKALLEALVDTEVATHRYRLDDLRTMFEIADREKLRAAGEPLPSAGPFTVYRGVTGRGTARRVRGLSWTGSVDMACWFAHRFGDLSDPAVFQVTVEEKDVLAYSHKGETGRGEDEYLILLPPSVKPQRIMSASETKRRADEVIAQTAVPGRTCVPIEIPIRI